MSYIQASPECIMVPRWPGGKQGRFLTTTSITTPSFGDNFIHMRFNSSQSQRFILFHGHKSPCLQALYGCQFIILLIQTTSKKNCTSPSLLHFSHSSDKSLLSPKLTSRHLQETTKSFQFLIATPFARKHIKPEDFDNAITYQLQFTTEKFTHYCNFIYTTSELLKCLSMP